MKVVHYDADTECQRSQNERKHRDERYETFVLEFESCCSTFFLTHRLHQPADHLNVYRLF